MSDIAYLDRAAATTHGQAYKRRLLDGLELRPGLRVLDVGCGPGTDLGEMAQRVAPGGQVLGLDRDPVMVAAAARRYADEPAVRVGSGDAHAIGLAGGSVDRVRLDRVMQHVGDPAAVMREVRRVLRPGGRAGFADPDWDTLAIADEDVATSRGYTQFVTGEAVRNSSMGRELPRLAAAAGMRLAAIESTSVLFTGYDEATAILKLPEVAQRAVAAGYLGADAAAAWLQRLRTAPVFLASVTSYVVIATR